MTIVFSRLILKVYNLRDLKAALIGKLLIFDITDNTTGEKNSRSHS